MKLMPMAFRGVLLSLALSVPVLRAQDGSVPVSAPASEDPAHREARLKWFHEARFGMFIHWGVYSVPAGEWQGKPVNGIGEWILRNGRIPVASYKAFAPQFTAAKYDPKAWAALARQAGMKYVVITAKHHDGFALYDSAASDWNAAQASGAHRDLLTPLAEAVRGEGLKFGLYYSQAQDWTHPGGAIAGTPEGNKTAWDAPAQAGSFDDYLKTIALPQLQEILTRYQPAIIWFDTPNNMNTARATPLAAALKKLAPEIICNDRLGGGFSGDTKTPEQHIPPRGFPGQMFEVCMTMNDTWGFKKNDLNWKSVRQIVRNLSDISSKGGNFLLNVGPTCEGEIPAASIERLQSVGRWMGINGEAIYASEANPFPRRLNWGRVTRKSQADGATTFYVHVWDWPQNGKLLLPKLQNAPVSGRVLASGAAVKCNLTPEGVELELPGTAPDPDVSVLALNFPSAPTIHQEAFVTPGSDGRFLLSSADADTFGGLSGNLERLGAGDQAYLADWRDANWHVEYPMKTAVAGKWKLRLEIASEKPVSLTASMSGKAKVSVTGELAATGGMAVWKEMDLGTLELPAGEVTLELKAVKKDWSSIHLRTVSLTPVK